MRDDPLPGTDEAVELLLKAASIPRSGPQAKEELRSILADLEALLPVLRGQEWGQAVQREHRCEEC